MNKHIVKQRCRGQVRIHKLVKHIETYRRTGTAAITYEYSNVSSGRFSCPTGIHRRLALLRTLCSVPIVTGPVTGTPTWKCGGMEENTSKMLPSHLMGGTGVYVPVYVHIPITFNKRFTGKYGGRKQVGIKIMLLPQRKETPLGLVCRTASANRMTSLLPYQTNHQSPISAATGSDSDWKAGSRRHKSHPPALQQHINVSNPAMSQRRGEGDGEGEGE
jgi:hypothetical protein